MTTQIRPVDLKLEVVVIPVSDVDRSKRFYQSLGWRLDADYTTRPRVPGDPNAVCGERGESSE